MKQFITYPDMKTLDSYAILRLASFQHRNGSLCLLPEWTHYITLFITKTFTIMNYKLVQAYMAATLFTVFYGVPNAFVNRGQ